MQRRQPHERQQTEKLKIAQEEKRASQSFLKKLAQIPVIVSGALDAEAVAPPVYFHQPSPASAPTSQSETNPEQNVLVLKLPHIHIPRLDDAQRAALLTQFGDADLTKLWGRFKEYKFTLSTEASGATTIKHAILARPGFTIESLATRTKQQLLDAAIHSVAAPKANSAESTRASADAAPPAATTALPIPGQNELKPQAKGNKQC
ncbi:hypothetical protein MKEN_00839500 [Mycena kentingensis (nom. inval.)]|nr:hypothetical protein MKEN_00839500 [Mycena kentingensis (nom. inval.)]